MPPPGHSETLASDHCRLCWLWHHRPDYRDLWEAPAELPTAPKRPVSPEHDCHDPNRLDRYFGRVVVINLRRRPDRLTSFRRELRRHGWPFQEPDVFEAIDGERVPMHGDWRSSPGAWGCMQSHRQILERAIADDVASVLVLEDDLKLTRTFRAQVEQFLRSVPDDWDQLMLGGQHCSPPQQVRPGIVRCTVCMRTHAYAIRGRMLRDLYAEWHSSRGNTHCDHIMGWMQANYRVYAPESFLVGQARSQSDISLGSNPVSFWNGWSNDEPVVVIEAPREVVEELREQGDLHTGFHHDPETGFDIGLQQVFASNGHGFAAWINQRQQECITAENALVGIWHPNATVQAAKDCWQGPVHHLKAATIEESLDQLRQIRRQL